MNVIVPVPEAAWQPAADGSDSLSNVMAMAKSKQLTPAIEHQMALLCSKPPEFDDASKGRGKQAAVNCSLGGKRHLAHVYVLLSSLVCLELPL
jgi:hypothetical protein